MSWGFTLEPFGTVLEAIEAWQPQGCKTEKDCEKSLFRELQQELVNQTIQTQYGSGRQRIDIVVHKKVPIEIKKDLKSTGAYHRLIGQLEEYLQDWDHMILVLCGVIKSDLKKSLEGYIDRKVEGHFLNEKEVTLVIKGVEE